MVDAVAAAEREAVDERPAEEANVGAECERPVNVRTAPDAGVERDGGVVADLLDDVRERSEERRVGKECRL